MKSVTSFKALNLRPTIVVSHEALQAIKRIVRIAPQEAQWFHTIDPIRYKDSPGEVFLHLSDKLYIPKQNTAATQVDSTSSMMIEFYHELKEQYVDQETVNQKLNSMTCWCHSHHNMTPNPSGQDNSQFDFFVKSAIDQNQSCWQLMLIFNKKDQFYSRVWDPSTGLVFEGVDIQISTPYDFSYIDKAAKTKFVKPPVKTKPFFKANSRSKSLTSNIPEYDEVLDPYSIFSQSLPSAFYSDEEINSELALDTINEIYSKIYPDQSTYFLKNVRHPKLKSADMYIDLMKSFDDQEALWLSFILDDKVSNIKNLWTQPQKEAYLTRYAQKVDERILNYLNSTSDTLSCFQKKLTLLFSLTDAPNKASFLQIIATYLTGNPS
jgi:hypothetical protein